MLRQVGTDIADQRDFDRSRPPSTRSATCRGSDLLTGLRGKDVILVFVESYGRVAVEDPDGVRARRRRARRRRTRGSPRPASAPAARFLTSSTAGGGSWLAHSTLQSGLWIDNQQRYRDLVGSDRLTLTGAFRGPAGARSPSCPATRGPGRRAAFFGFDQIYDALHLGYRGPRFSFSSMPDQYTLSAFQRAERAPPATRR